MSEQATRDWFRRASVRILEDVTCHNTAFQRHTYTRGQEVEMLQWGRAGRPVDRAWWSDFDIDLAFIIESDKVEIVRILEEKTP
jgi:hypothetical protein